jgi:hypothetical protein
MSNGAYDKLELPTFVFARVQIPIVVVEKLVMRERGFRQPLIAGASSKLFCDAGTTLRSVSLNSQNNFRTTANWIQDVLAIISH